MKFIFEILPVLLFFLVFKFYDIYAATLVGIIATYVQAVSHRWYTGQWSKQQVVTLAAFLVFGGMTLYFHDPRFIKWKPTVVFWIFTLVIFITQFFMQKPIMQRLMEHMLEGKASIPTVAWRRINLCWGLFFMTLGAINLYVAYSYSNDAWVNFKFYGVTSALIIASIVQSIYLTRFMIDIKSTP